MTLPAGVPPPTIVPLGSTFGRSRAVHAHPLPAAARKGEALAVPAWHDTYGNTATQALSTEGTGWTTQPWTIQKRSKRQAAQGTASETYEASPPTSESPTLDRSSSGKDDQPEQPSTVGESKAA